MTDRRRAALAAIYAELPTMNCLGLCALSCHSLAQTQLEQEHVLAETGIQLDLVQVSPCAALTMLRRCGAYDARPLMCRLWGMTPTMRCQYGCQPEGGFLTDRQAYALLTRVAELDRPARKTSPRRDPRPRGSNR